MPDIAQSISRAHLFKNMSMSDVARIASVATRATVDKGATIIKEGDAGDALYLIEAGSVMVCKGAGSGQQEVLAVLDIGELFGEMALIDHAPRSASVIALELTNLLVVRDADLDRLSQEDASFAVRLYRNLALTVTRRLRRASDKLRILSEEGVAARASVERMIDDMLTVISHELRTPVTVIQGATELLESVSLSPEKRSKFLANIHEHTHRLALLLDDIFQMADTQFRDVRVDKKPGNIAEIISNVAFELKSNASKKNIKVTLDLAAIPKLVPIHSTKLRRAIFHIVDNGIKFNRDSGELTIDAMVDITCTPPQLTISFRDKGCGIPPEKREDLFRCFRQEIGPLDPRRKAGLGLGLPLAHSIVAAHGGKLVLESPKEGGSIFKILLPIAYKDITDQ